MWDKHFDADKIFEYSCFKCKYYDKNIKTHTHGAGKCIQQSKNVVWNDTCESFEPYMTRERLNDELRRDIRSITKGY